MAAFTAAICTHLGPPTSPPFSSRSPPRCSKIRGPALLHLATSRSTLPRYPSVRGLTRRHAAAVTDKQGDLWPRRRRKWKWVCPVLCSAQSSDPSSSPSSSWWKLVQQKVVAPERVLRIISGATSSPICQFIESPSTVLHSVDPRIKLKLVDRAIHEERTVQRKGLATDRAKPTMLLRDCCRKNGERGFADKRKLVWLLALVILPARSPVLMRYGIVVYLALLSIWCLPARVWMDQLGRVAFLSGIIFVALSLGSDVAPSLVQSRTPPPVTTGLPNVPSSLSGYSYSILKLGPLHLTRKGFLVASTSACLSFTIFQSASLCLATTTPEQLASALRWFLLPLTAIGTPVAEIILTLLLSLRFINLVFDEVRSAALGIVTRRINWQKLTLLETLDIFVMYVRRIFKNIFNHAEQISQAMIVRGFRGDCNTHKIYLDPNPSFGIADIVSLFCLIGLIAATMLAESFLI